jgi:predicted phage-related endonuclease
MTETRAPSYIFCEQGTEEWHKSRCGRVTGSRFPDVITKTGKRSTGKVCENYMFDIVGEILTGEPADKVTAKALEWGKRWEPVARQVYEELKGVKVQEVGFVVAGHDSLIGCSPDGLIGDDGCLELKCPATSRQHLRNIRSRAVPDEYWAQVQGHLWITGRKWCDFGSFDPRMNDIELALVTVRVQRDESYISCLADVIDTFAVDVRATLMQIERMVGRGN